MKPLSVIVAQSNAKTGELLTKSLYNLAGFEQVQQLTRQFSATKIVCTHRLADEKMWAEALAAGAADCCHSSDVRAIVLAASNIKTFAHAHAA